MEVRASFLSALAWVVRIMILLLIRHAIVGLASIDEELAKLLHLSRILAELVRLLILYSTASRGLDFCFAKALEPILQRHWRPLFDHEVLTISIGVASKREREHLASYGTQFACVFVTFPSSRHLTVWRVCSLGHH